MILALVIATALMAGIYFSFSVVVVKALAHRPGREGADAMNQINEVILKTSFMPLFFASSLLYAGLLLWSVFFSNTVQADLIAASLFYLIGMFGVTAFGNVPLNNRLKQSADDADQLLSNWRRYTRVWVKLNHLRTLSCVAALVLLINHL